MEVVLTGRDAAEAIGLYARLGAVGARFDGRRVVEAVRTSAGRARLAAAVRSATVRATSRLRTPARRPRARRRPTAPRAWASTSASPPRPRDPLGRGA